MSFRPNSCSIFLKAAGKAVGSFLARICSHSFKETDDVKLRVFFPNWLIPRKACQWVIMIRASIPKKTLGPGIKAINPLKGRRMVSIINKNRCLVFCFCKKRKNSILIFLSLSFPEKYILISFVFMWLIFSKACSCRRILWGRSISFFRAVAHIFFKRENSALI